GHFFLLISDGRTVGRLARQGSRLRALRTFVRLGPVPRRRGEQPAEALKRRGSPAAGQTCRWADDPLSLIRKSIPLRPGRPSRPDAASRTARARSAPRPRPTGRPPAWRTGP